jgi:hypothetical protein
MKKSIPYEILTALTGMAGAILLVFTYYPIINPMQYRIDNDRETAPVSRFIIGTPVSLLILSGAWYFNRKTQNLKQAENAHSYSGRPLFELFVGEKKVAELYDPKGYEMFWCSYRIQPISKEADDILRNEAVWSEVGFTVKTKDGRIPNRHIFTGGNYASFCKRETDRLSFRSFWPIDS